MTQKGTGAAAAVLTAVLVLLIGFLGALLVGAYIVFCDRDSLPETSGADQTAQTTAFSSGEAPDTIGAPGAGRREESVAEEDGPVIVLDPGHGLGDPGCTSLFLEETEARAVLEIAVLLKEKLEQQGAKVYLTHDGTSCPSAEELREMAAQYGIDCQEDRLLSDEEYSPYERTVYALVCNAMEPVSLFLSLHVNSLPDHPEVGRGEIYYCRENPWADELVELSEALVEVLGPDTMTEATEYEKAFIVTKYVGFSAVLLEMGYATNPEDAENLNSDSWREMFCTALSEAILHWSQSMENKG